ncbi:MAG: response regulator [Proteobacteria bacterium]|nr:response regulator [Pseudomonadota bacterium]MBU1717137.1 response regulator [Pseudomonadota bacterium]
MLPIKNKTRVLVAEDAHLVTEIIKRALNEMDFELIGTAVNGEEAVHMAMTMNPDVVLMDIMMPVLDGLEATRQIQKQSPVPVVILTSHESPELINKANEVGAAAYLMKPPQKAEIERAIIIAMGRHADLMKCIRLNKELREALTEIKTLRGILPLCSFCKKIRDDTGYWNQVDDYIRKNSSASISHSVCPDCMDEHYPDESEMIQATK